MSPWWLIPAFLGGGAAVYIAVHIWMVVQANRFWR